MPRSVYGPPPAKWAGTCQAGEGFTAAMCSNKLIGARFYNADFAASGAVRAGLEYLSPRDGVGAIITNPDATAPVNDPHTLPTIQLSNASRTAVRDYAATAGATATVGFSTPALSTIDRNAVAAGTLTPPWTAGSLSGTSRSSPHVAGSAALLRQMFPTWTQAAIKSALTTANTAVRLSNNTIDANRWGYGAGHLHPNGAIVPSLVYDAGSADYGRFLCGLGLAVPAGMGSCNALGSIKSWDLNLSSLTAAGVVVSRTLTRTVTNVGASTATFVSSSSGRGSRVFTVESSYTGTISMAVVGLVPAILNGVSIATGATQCFNFTVPAGTQFARWQLFNADTQGGASTDLDLEVFRLANCTGTNVGTGDGPCHAGRRYHLKAVDLDRHVGRPADLARGRPVIGP